MIEEHNVLYNDLREMHEKKKIFHHVIIYAYD